MPDAADPVVHFMAGQLAAFTRLGTLRHFDLQFFGIGQVVAGYAEPAGSDLLDRGAFPVAVGLDFEPDFIVMNGAKTAAQNWEELGLNSENFVVFNLTEKMQLIGGTWYGGEMKKGMFGMMNYYLPLKGIAHALLRQRRRRRRHRYLLRPVRHR